LSRSAAAGKIESPLIPPASNMPASPRVRVRWTLHTLSLVSTVLAMGYAGAVQNNGAAYLLCFLAATVGAMSWLQARANLRGLEIRAGRGVDAQVTRLPVEIHARTGQAASALEVLIAGAGVSTLVERVESGATARLSLKLPIQECGTRRKALLVIRSAYPLGMFSAESAVEVDCLRRTHPQPIGSLPLPLAETLPQGSAPASSAAQSRSGREGDDFAGLREWQRGDSPRHIDWRGEARGGPLMVKQWASASGASVRLDWESLPLPEAERAGQIARWIAMCEMEGTAYALRLPGLELPVGCGAAHARRCLDALADHHSSLALQETAAVRKRVPATHEHAAALALGPLLLLCGMLLAAALPLLDFLAPVCVVLLLLCILVRGTVLRRPGPRWVPALVLALGVAGIWSTQGSLMSMEAGIATLVVLLGAKLLESRTPHDFQVLAMIGWFLCLCGLLSAQSLDRSLWTFGVFAGIAACMVRFRRGTPGMAVPLRLTGLMLARALPVAVLLFFVFPRGSLEHLARFGTSRTSRTGIPTALTPGGVASVARSEEVAFRTEFPDQALPQMQDRYWRCVVLWECDGLTWRRGPRLEYPARAPLQRSTDVRQIIMLEPHGQLWLPALDFPRKGRDNYGPLNPDYDDTLVSAEPVQSLRRIEVTSRMLLDANVLPQDHQQAALQRPTRVPPALQTLAAQWRSTGQTDAVVVQVALDHLRAQGFSYTLEPGTYTGPDALEDFLLRRRTGFCEHFSASFATMMRLAGVPARVVLGYFGGEWNPRGGFMTVRQSDAHAWTEVWLTGRGWTRVDPTAELAPGRMNVDLRTYLAGGEAELARQRGSLLWQGWQAVRMFWDDLGYQWQNYVIEFDEESQIEWLSRLGLGRVRGSLLLLISVGIMSAALLLLALWLRRPARHRDPWARAWLRLCRRLEKLGLPARQPHEGPLAYAARISAARPALATQLTELAQMYARGRYGPAAIPLRRFEQAARLL